MAWRLPRAEFVRGKGEANRRAFQQVVKSGPPPGILAYDGKAAVGWCAVAPRERFTHLARSRTLLPVDDRPVWSVTCFFIRKEYRKRGLTVRLLKAAAEFVRGQGGRIVEGYPVIVSMDRMPDVFAWTGAVPAFEKAGFRECPTTSKSRKVMRRELNA